ncbi:MAG: MoaD/ThiS family protein [Balneolaceae bacterium]|nr:MoaD/ThiS family protein [Balneolaceae bacterium]
MTLNLKLFGITKDVIGATELEYNVSPSAASVSSLKQKLIEEFRELDSLKSLAIAVNVELSSQDLSISEQDEIALIPPDGRVQVSDIAEVNRFFSSSQRGFRPFIK